MALRQSGDLKTYLLHLDVALGLYTLSGSLPSARAPFHALAPLSPRPVTLVARPPALTAMCYMDFRAYVLQLYGVVAGGVVDHEKNREE
jgi:hypothetical protein